MIFFREDFLDGQHQRRSKEPSQMFTEAQRIKQN